MGWKLSSTTGKWLLGAAGGLWQLCSCCTPDTCPQVYLVYSCNQEFDSETCSLGETRYWICSDDVIQREGGGADLSPADLDSVGGVLLSPLVTGCFWVDTEHGPIDFEDIPPGTVQFPTKRSGTEDYNCEDTECDPDYTGTCDCLCYTTNRNGGGEADYCCYGNKNASGDSQMTFTYTKSYSATRTATLEGDITGTTPTCNDDCVGELSCTFAAYTLTAVGTQTAGGCEVCRDTLLEWTACKGLNCVGCCADDDNTQDDVEGEICTPGNDWTTVNSDTETVFETLGVCERKTRTVIETLANTCTSFHKRTTVHQWIFSRTLDVPAECGCFIKETFVTDEQWTWDQGIGDGAESRLCIMCRESLYP